MPELSREPAIEPESPDSSASASSILRYLTELDTSAKQFPRTLSSMLNSDDFAAFVSSLREDEIIIFIDFVDRVSFNSYRNFFLPTQIVGTRFRVGG